MHWLGVCGLGAIALIGSAWACSVSDGSSANNGTGASATGANGGAGAGAGGNGSAGFTQNGGNGAGGVDDCVGISEMAQPALEPADIVFAIDTSGSMGEESFFVRDKMNAFSAQIVATGIDVRVVMLAMVPPPIPCFGMFCPPGICIDAPLGSGACPGDEKPPAYYHPTSAVDSNDSLQVIYDLWGSYGSVLREDANTYLVIITDDEYIPDGSLAMPIAGATDFVTRWTALDAAKLGGFVAHAIYCFNGNGDCVTKGQVYEDLVNATGGIHGNLALQDFQPIFDNIAAQIVTNAGELPCEYAIPAPPMGESLDPDEVNVVFTDGTGAESTIYRVDGEAECDAVDGGWYYDNPAAPTKVLLCPASCDVVSSDPDGKIDIVFGCATELPPIE
jgi:hypothetical protein